MRNHSARPSFFKSRGGSATKESSESNSGSLWLIGLLPGLPNNSRSAEGRGFGPPRVAIASTLHQRLCDFNKTRRADFNNGRTNRPILRRRLVAAFTRFVFIFQQTASGAMAFETDALRLTGATDIAGFAQF